MRSTAIGLAMLNDERPHVYEKNNPENMAVLQAWAKLLRDNIVNADGSKPEVVVASEIITDVRKGQKIGEELARAGCKQIIMCYNVWNFPFLAWPFVNSLGNVPILSLSNNNGKFPGNVGLLATDGALRQAGRRTHRIVGNIDDPETQQKVFDWVRASQAATNIRNEVYGLYGGHSMGMETGYFHMVPTQKALGCTCRQIDQFLLIKEAEAVDQKEVDKALAWFDEMLGDRILWDDDMLTKETLGKQARIYIAMQRLNKQYGFDFCGLKGQRELTENYTLGDVPEMIMNDPYDWNGPKEPTICATEADSYAAVTMQLLKYITGGLPILFMDVRLYVPELDLWDWCNSGNHASWYAMQSNDPKENFSKVHFHPALKYYFKAGGASVEFDAKPGPMTFCRLGLWDDKPFMAIVAGDNADLSAEERKRINEQTDPTWPHVHAKLHCGFEEFLSIFPCNHVQGAPGDLIQPLVYLCEMTGITPVVLGKEAADRIPPIWERVQ